EIVIPSHVARNQSGFRENLSRAGTVGARKCSCLSLELRAESWELKSERLLTYPHPPPTGNWGLATGNRLLSSSQNPNFLLLYTVCLSWVGVVLGGFSGSGSFGKDAAARCLVAGSRANLDSDGWVHPLCRLARARRWLLRLGSLSFSFLLSAHRSPASLVAL